MKYPIWKTNFWFGGFSDDRFMGIQNSFQYAKGIEIRKNPNSIKLAWDSVKDSGSIVTDHVLSMVTVKSTGDILAFGDTGKIYRKTAGAGNWVLCYTDTTNRKILNSFEYNSYVYWATPTHLHRIAVASIDDAWAGTVTEDYKAFTNANANAHPMIELYNKMYIGDGFYLAELASTMVWTPTKLTIFNDEEIRALTFIGTIMRIYSRKSNLSSYSSQYLWDGTSTDYNQRNIWNGMSVHCAITGGDGQDYVVAGKRPYLYVTSGYERNELKRIPLVADGQSLSLSPNALSIFDGLIAIGMGESGTNSVGRGIWTWGREDSKYPYSLNFEYPTSNDNTTDVVGCVHNANGVLYQSWKNGTSYGIDKVDTAKYRTSGYLISRVLYGDDPADVKSCRSTQLAFKQLAVGEKIELFYRKNLTSFESTASITAQYSDTADRAVNEKKRYEADGVGDFNFLEAKIQLTAGTSQLTSPEVMGLSVEFDPTIEVGA